MSLCAQPKACGQQKREHGNRPERDPARLNARQCRNACRRESGQDRENSVDSRRGNRVDDSTCVLRCKINPDGVESDRSREEAPQEGRDHLNPKHTAETQTYLLGKQEDVPTSRHLNSRSAIPSPSKRTTAPQWMLARCAINGWKSICRTSHAMSPSVPTIWIPSSQELRRDLDRRGIEPRLAVTSTAAGPIERSPSVAYGPPTRRARFIGSAEPVACAESRVVINCAAREVSQPASRVLPVPPLQNRRQIRTSAPWQTREELSAQANDARRIISGSVDRSPGANTPIERLIPARSAGSNGACGPVVSGNAM